MLLLKHSLGVYRLDSDGKILLLIGLWHPGSGPYGFLEAGRAADVFSRIPDPERYGS